jgi:L-alanine-DL-glutamate epimerase-like enolase superfamily enzyme
MTITEIKPLVCHGYRTNWVFVNVMTDEGVHGVGEVTLEYREPTLMECIRDHGRIVQDGTYAQLAACPASARWPGRAGAGAGGSRRLPIE